MVASAVSSGSNIRKNTRSKPSFTAKAIPAKSTGKA